MNVFARLVLGLFVTLSIASPSVAQDEDQDEDSRKEDRDNDRLSTFKNLSSAQEAALVTES